MFETDDAVYFGANRGNYFIYQKDTDDFIRKKISNASTIIYFAQITNEEKIIITLHGEILIFDNDVIQKRKLDCGDTTGKKYYDFASCYFDSRGSLCMGRREGAGM